MQPLSGASSAVPSGDTTRIAHRIALPPTVAAGTYSGGVDYVAVINP
jgi:hypothetical protein